jgi:two-component system OmpR family response regulator
MTILLVEPYSPLARALVRGLEEEGITAHVARDDVEADVRARTMPYAALLVNWNVPRKGGAALVRGWRQGGLAAPIFLFVPSPGDADRLLGFAAGADEVLALPFSFADLLARLRSWLSSPKLSGVAPVAAANQP